VILCWLTLLALWVCCSKPKEQPLVTELEKEEKELVLTGDGAWCWFSDPRAVYYEGEHRRTYSGWVKADGSIEVGFYDHDTDSVASYTIDPKLQIDDHNNPTFLIDPQGKLLVFYSKHSSKDPIYLARTRLPERIDQWEPVQELILNDSTLFEQASNTYTYTNIVQLSQENNKMYLFWRGVDFKPNFSISENNGYNWSKGNLLILPERIYSNRRPYLKVASNHKDVIHFAFTDGHPRKEPTNSIYYLQYRDGGLYRGNGTLIKRWEELPISPSQSDVVYDATKTGERAWIWDVAGDNLDRPVMVYSRFPDDSTHIYYYATWSENGWKNVKLINSGGWFPQTKPGETEREPNYSGGITLDHTDPSIVYLSVEKNGVFEIERWQTPDLGDSWTKQEITQNSKNSNIRPFAVRNRPAETSVMVTWERFEEYLHYTDYQSAILYHVDSN